MVTIISKWFQQKLGNEGLAKLVAGFPDKGAEAVCTFAYSPGPGHTPILFQGRTKVSSPFQFSIQAVLWNGNVSISSRAHNRARVPS